VAQPLLAVRLWGAFEFAAACSGSLKRAAIASPLARLRQIACQRITPHSSHRERGAQRSVSEGRGFLRTSTFPRFGRGTACRARRCNLASPRVIFDFDFVAAQGSAPTGLRLRSMAICADHLQHGHHPAHSCTRYRACFIAPSRSAPSSNPANIPTVKITDRLLPPCIANHPSNPKIPVKK
jgi:hypothetical protein